MTPGMRTTTSARHFQFQVLVAHCPPPSRTCPSGSLGAGYASVAYSAVSVLIVVAWVLVLAIYHTRAQQVVGAGPEEFRRVWTATLWVFGVIAIVSTLFKLEIARGYLAIAFPLGLFALSVNRHVARVFLAAQRRRGRCMTAVLAVGEPISATVLAQSLTRRPSDGYSVVGVCTPGGVARESIVVPGLGPVRVFAYDGDIRHAIAASQADTVALTSAAELGPEGMRDLSWPVRRTHEPASAAAEARAEERSDGGRGPGEGENPDERQRLIDAMERSGWVQAKAARFLRLTPRQMGYALRKHNVEIKRF